MKVFYIGFSRNRKNKIFSRLLMWYMSKNYSHTYFKFGEASVLHSEMENGVNYWTSKEFEEKNITTMEYRIQIPENEYTDLRERLNRHVGHRYAYLQNLGILLVDLFVKFGIKKRNPFRDGDNCSELVFRSLKRLHPELKKDYRPNTVRPDHIEEILEKYGYTKVL